MGLVTKSILRLFVMVVAYSLPAYAFDPQSWFEKNNEVKKNLHDWEKELEKVPDELKGYYWLWVSDQVRQFYKKQDLAEIYKKCASFPGIQSSLCQGMFQLVQCVYLNQSDACHLSWDKSDTAIRSRYWIKNVLDAQRAYLEGDYYKMANLFASHASKWPQEERRFLFQKWSAEISDSLVLCKISLAYYFDIVELDAIDDKFWKSECIPSQQQWEKRIRKWMAHNEKKKVIEEWGQYLQTRKIPLEQKIYFDSLIAFLDYDFESSTNTLKSYISEFVNSQKVLENGIQSSIASLYLMSIARQGQLQAAAEEARKLARVAPSNKKTTFLMDEAFYLFQAGLWKEALKKYKKLIKNPLSALEKETAYWHLGFLYFLQNKPQNAIFVWNTLLKTKSFREQSRVYYWLVRAHFQKKEYHQVKYYLDQIFAKDKNFPGYYSILALQFKQANELFLYPLLRRAIQGELKNGDDYQFFPIDVSRSFHPLDEENWSTKIGSENPKKSESVKRTLAQENCLTKEWETVILIGYIELLPQQASVCLEDGLAQTLLKAHKYKSLVRWAAQRGQPKLEWLFPRAFESIVIDNSMNWNVPPELVWGIMRAESLYDAQVESPAHAKGLLQIMPYTAQNLAKLIGYDLYKSSDQLFDPQINIFLGTAYLRRLLDQFHQQLPLAIAAYNAGPHRVKTWLYRFGSLPYPEFIELIPFQETRNYVKKVISYYFAYRASWDLKGKIDVPDSVKIPEVSEVWEEI